MKKEELDPALLENLKEYVFRVRWFPETSQWMGQCPQYMALYHFADDPAEAITGIIKKVAAVHSAGLEPKDGNIFTQMDESLSGDSGPLGKH